MPATIIRGPSLIGYVVLSIRANSARIVVEDRMLTLMILECRGARANWARQGDTVRRFVVQPLDAFLALLALRAL